VPQVGLQRPGVVALVGQRKATGVAQHVGVGWEAQAGGLTSAPHQLRYLSLLLL
jgi:hypothetical protein